MILASVAPRTQVQDLGRIQGDGAELPFESPDSGIILSVRPRNCGRLAMRHVIFGAAFGVALSIAPALVGSDAALAFTVESHGAIQSDSAQAKSNAGPANGFLDMDASSLMPPVGESISGSSFDFSPRSFNNGLAAQPTRGGSVGPAWLYPPGR